MTLNRMSLLFTAGACVAAGLAGCASSVTLPPEVPAALRPPADQKPYLQALATGVQIYECAAVPSSGGFAWTFRAPEATLNHADGQLIGKHFAGPTWQAVDLSAVVGEVKAKDAGPDPAAIPWLLLAAKSHSGNGVFSDALSIQRLQTVGGNAPASGCDADHLLQVARVPYTATYYFYR